MDTPESETVKIQWGVRLPDGTVAVHYVPSDHRSELPDGNEWVRRTITYTEWEKVPPGPLVAGGPHHNPKD